MQNFKLPLLKKSNIKNIQFPTKWINLFFLVSFTGIISIGVWTKLLGRSNNSADTVESKSTSFPYINSLPDWVTFPSRIDTYLSDNFPVQTELARRNFWTRYKLLKQKIFPKMIVGKDEWLFYTAEQNISDFEKTNLFSHQQIKEIQNKVDRWGQFFEEQNIPFVILIAPNKETIYPEYVPEIIQ